MRIALLCSSSATHTCSWTAPELTRRGHQVTATAPEVATFTEAAEVGHRLAGEWADQAPDAILALGWEAGLAAQVAARDTSSPVVLRLTRVGRAPGAERQRLQTALAAGSSMVLVPSAGELDRLVDRGVPRNLVRVLPEAVDRHRFVDGNLEPATGTGNRVALVRPSAEERRAPLLATLSRLPGCVPIPVPEAHDAEQRPGLLRTADAVLATDDTDPQVSLVLQAMACGVPAVAVDTGLLSDLVADGITGLLVPRSAALPEALRSLLADPMLRESMGMAAVDRVRARFDTSVVGAALERLLLEVTTPEQEQAAAS